MAKPANNTQKIVDSQGNTVTYINPHTIDDSKFDLDLVGSEFLNVDNLSSLAASINKNFIKHLQNFYSDQPPFNPVIGQSWVNSHDNLTYMWFGNSWIQKDKDTTYDTFMFVKYSEEEIREFVLDEFVFNYTMDNIKLYNQNLKELKFILDAFDSRKIIIKERKVTTVYAVIFHPKDKISNPLVNKKVEMVTDSGQTQFNLNSFLNGSSINNLTITLNNVMLKNNEFQVTNDILNIDGKIYRIRKNDKLNVWLYGGSLSIYKTTFKIHTNARNEFLRIPKFFNNIESIEIVDVDENKTVNPILVHETADFYEFEFIDKKNVVATAILRIM